jgi:hypothetical protein
VALAGAAALATVALGTGAAGTAALRLADRRRAARACARLMERRLSEPAPFAPAMGEGLPEPARRYLRYAIAPGVPLRLVAEIEMTGVFGLGNRDAPRYLPMRAHEILAPPHGFVWLPSIGAGLVRFAGSDGCVDDEAWTRFWLMGVVPIVRPAMTPDLVRAARARALAEALWVPAALLPRHGARWEPIDAERARVVFAIAGERFALDLTVAADGRPIALATERWSNANPERTYRFQPFGGTIDEMGAFAGYRVPMRIAVGNHFGTDAYFPFFRTEWVSVAYG